MTLTPFIRDTAYFQVARDRGIMPTAENFDIQFNQLTDYINNDIIPVVEIISDGELLGEIDNEGSFLLNIGDGKTKFQTINNELIPNNEIEWLKLKNALPASILATDINYDFIAITATNDNQVLVSENNSAPLFKALNGNNLPDNTITGAKFILNTIGAEHLQPDMLGRPLDDGAVQEPYIADGNVTGTKTADGAITPEKIEASLLAQARANVAFGVGRNYAVLDSRNFTDNSIDFNKYFAGKKLLTLEHIDNNSLVLKVLDNNSNRINTQDYIADNAVQSYHIRPQSYDIGLNANSLTFPPNYLLSKYALSPEIRRVLRI